MATAKNPPTRKCEEKPSGWCVTHNARSNDHRCRIRRAWEREFATPCVACNELMQKEAPRVFNPALIEEKETIEWPSFPGKPDITRLFLKLFRKPNTAVCDDCIAKITTAAGESLKFKDSAETIPIFVTRVMPLEEAVAEAVKKVAAKEPDDDPKSGFRSVQEILRIAMDSRRFRELQFATRESHRVADGTTVMPCIVAVNAPAICKTFVNWSELRVVEVPGREAGQKVFFGFCVHCVKVLELLELGVHVQDHSLQQAVEADLAIRHGGKTKPSSARFWKTKPVSGSAVATCNMSPTMQGNPTAALQFIPAFSPEKFQDPEACFDALGETKTRYDEILFGHSVGLDMERVKKPDSDERKAAKAEAKSCRLHGPEFSGLGMFRHLVVSHLQANWPGRFHHKKSSGDDSEQQMKKKFTCAQCRCGVDKLFGDLCGRCHKRQKNAGTRVQREVARNGRALTDRIRRPKKGEKQKKAA